MPTFQLSFWARDRKRGPKLPLELMVHRLSGDPAALYEMHDRGTLAVGKRADINVIDFDRLSVDIPRMHFDLPEGGGRLLQRSRGYLATMVNGETTRRFDEDTGARPGRLHRSGAVTETALAAE
jgi:N-acyl-D-aspartate/D-glutamate deacylase